MMSIKHLSDSDHPMVAGKAAALTNGKTTPLEKLESLFYFVRDGIRFGFTPRWDEFKASEVLDYGLGYCNTKTILLVALCRAVGINARVHFGLVDIRLMRGILPNFAFALIPKTGAHSWTEVKLEDEWRPIDSYINDRTFYEKALQHLKYSGRSLGYSVSRIDGKSSCEFNFGEQGFVHMGAVVEDHGEWEDSAEYFASSKYPRMSTFQLKLYPMLAWLANRNITTIRLA